MPSASAGVRTGSEKGFGLSYGIGLGYKLTNQGGSFAPSIALARKISGVSDVKSTLTAFQHVPGHSRRHSTRALISQSISRYRSSVRPACPR